MSEVTAKDGEHNEIENNEIRRRGGSVEQLCSNNPVDPGFETKLIR